MKTGQDKVFGARLEGFVECTYPIVSESTEEREAEMPSLTAGFAKRMHKRATNTQGKATPDFEGPYRKCFKQFGPVEEVQISPTVISASS